MEDYIKSKETQISIAPKFELIIPVKTFIELIKQNYDRLYS